ncbi:MAG: HutP family protein [Thermoanaerobacteraceae bacterium]|nr:HutP family protein [Thermoanaerobacteraceae bacterium]
MMAVGSVDIAKIAVKMALSTREEEHELKAKYQENGIRVAAVDFGGDFSSSIQKIVERTCVAAKREGIVTDTHVGEGAVAGAIRDALMEISLKASGFNVGGKVGLARYGEHLTVCAFFGIGLLNLNEVVIGLGHRSIGKEY